MLREYLNSFVGTGAIGTFLLLLCMAAFLVLSWCAMRIPADRIEKIRHLPVDEDKPPRQ